MDRTGFWKLISSAREGAEDDGAFQERMGALLSQLGPDDLVRYEQEFDQLHALSCAWPLWGAAYLINGGCSDDGFEYFRAWLIAQGREVFERALSDPDSLAEVATSDDELEDFWYLAPQNYRERTGKETPRAQVDRPELGEQWDFDDADEMERRYPKLFAMFGA